MGNLGGELEKKLNKLGIKKQVEASMIVEGAQKKIEELFGERGAQNLKVVSFKNGILKIAATNNAWAAEAQAQHHKFFTEDVLKVVFISTLSE